MGVPISFGLKYFGISKSTFYHWKASLTDKKRLKKQAEKEEYKNLIREIFKDSKDTYGSR